MRFRLPAACAAISLALLTAVSPARADLAPPSVAASAYVLVDVTSGQTLASMQGDDRRDPASLTKLMTAYLVFDALRKKTITPSQMVPVSTRAWKAPGSRMFIEPRKAVSVDELLRGMIVQSGNDAAIAGHTRFSMNVGAQQAAKSADQLDARRVQLGRISLAHDVRRLRPVLAHQRGVVNRAVAQPQVVATFRRRPGDGRRTHERHQRARKEQRPDRAPSQRSAFHRRGRKFSAESVGSGHPSDRPIADWE